MIARVAGPRKAPATSAGPAPRPSSARSTSTATGSRKAPGAAAPAPAPGPAAPRSTTSTSTGTGSGSGPAAQASAGGAPPSTGASPSSLRNWLAQRAPQRTPRQEKVHAVAGALLGLVAYSMFINGIRYGPSGVTGWLSAKFLNKPMQGLPVATLPSQPTTTPTGPVNA